jgi:hypothetical protein
VVAPTIRPGLVRVIFKIKRNKGAKKNNKKEIHNMKNLYSREKEMKIAAKISITKYKVIQRPSQTSQTRISS